MTVTTGNKQKKISDPMLPVPVEIRRIVWETDDTFTLLIEPQSQNGAPYAFKPGQFNMLYSFGMGESAISISSDPRKPKLISHTIHRVGIVTSALSQLKKGDAIGLRGPFGSSWPIDELKGRDVIVVAGGIGLAPLRPLLYSIFHHRKDYGRIVLLYGARSPLDLLFRVELEKWGKEEQIEVLVTVDRGDSTWKGHIGVVSSLMSSIKIDAKSTSAVVCGPEIMMQFSIEEILQRGIAEENIHLSMERNMKCAVGFCGHCQYGPNFICKEGPVFPYTKIGSLLDKKEI
ncbi:MAG: FAD/NAD(P)-binding protein [Bacteroidota bacterium]